MALSIGNLKGSVGDVREKQRRLGAGVSAQKRKLVASETVLEIAGETLEKAGFSSKNVREKMDVLLIAPPLCSRKNIETMAQTLLVGLNFRSICIHRESTCCISRWVRGNRKSRALLTSVRKKSPQNVWITQGVRSQTR